MVSSEQDEGFTVSDRRRRVDEDSPPETTHAQPSALPPRQERSVIVPPSAGGTTHDVRGQSRPAAPEPPTSEPERNLVGLFVMLATSAAMALGDAADPMTGQVHIDLGQAAELIDVLVLLREKTEGHRTPEETQVLEEVIYDLQLRYVAATRRSGSPPGPPRR
jgi:hypothetical protein